MIRQHTSITVTPPGGAAQEIKIFDACQTTLSMTDRAGSFTLSFPRMDSNIVSMFPVGSDVLIEQDGVVFRGWVNKPPVKLNNILRTVGLDGVTYTAKTQKVIVTESYTGTAISDIVTDLIDKYLPWATGTGIQNCTKAITISFSDNYLWDAMEQLCTISGYDWYIDENLTVIFFGGTSTINPIVLSQKNLNYAQGSASFTPDAAKLVNRLWVKGSSAVSDPTTQAITVNGTTPIPLLYTPETPDIAPVTVVIGGNPMTVGIQNKDQAGTMDFLLNAAEKLLIPDLCTSGSGTIAYSYAYPIKLLLEDTASQAEHGVFEDILKVNTTDPVLAREQGLQYLAQYSEPVVVGSISPLVGVYKPGELVKIEIPNLDIDGYYQIMEVKCDSLPGKGIVNRSLSLQTLQRDAVSILKDLNNRLAALEKTVYNDSDGPVEKYNLFVDTQTAPRLVDDGATYNLHQYMICGTSQLCGTGEVI